jgi:hypothetical protein
MVVKLALLFKPVQHSVKQKQHLISNSVSDISTRYRNERNNPVEVPLIVGEVLGFEHKCFHLISVGIFNNLQQQRR